MSRGPASSPPKWAAAYSLSTPRASMYIGGEKWHKAPPCASERKLGLLACYNEIVLQPERVCVATHLLPSFCPHPANADPGKRLKIGASTAAAVTVLSV